MNRHENNAGIQNKILKDSQKQDYRREGQTINIKFPFHFTIFRKVISNLKG